MNKVIPLTILLGFTLPVLAAPTLIAEQGKEEGKLRHPLPDVQAGQRPDRDPGPQSLRIRWCTSM